MSNTVTLNECSSANCRLRNDFLVTHPTCRTRIGWTAAIRQATKTGFHCRFHECTSLPFISRSLNFIFCHLIFILPLPVDPLTRPSLCNILVTQPQLFHQWWRAPSKCHHIENFHPLYGGSLSQKFCGFRCEIKIFLVGVIATLSIETIAVWRKICSLCKG